MTLWELKNDGINHFAVMVFTNDVEVHSGMFELDGNPKHWSVRPGVEPFADKKVKAKPLADISYLDPGSVVLNAKAYVALKDFLLPFGQLLELDCKGEVYYFYNVTNLIACIDPDASEKKWNSIIREVFRPGTVPSTPQIFKDPHTAGRCIYINAAGKDVLETLLAAAHLTGARFVEAGKGVT